jgi:hypothetical protein
LSISRALAGVLAQGRVDRDQLQIAAAFQPLADLQARGARLAIDEDLGGHARSQTDQQTKKKALRFPEAPLPNA